MSFESAVAAATADPGDSPPPATAGAEVPEAGTAGGVPGSESPGPEGQAPGPVPYDRFQQVNERAKQFEQQYQQLSPWEAVVQRLTGYGYSPEQVAAQLEQLGQAPGPETAPAASDPNAAFTAYLAEQGLTEYDLEAMEPWQQALLRQGFGQAQQIRQWEARQREAEARAFGMRRETEFRDVQQRYPFFRPETSPTHAALLQDAFTALEGRVPLLDLAERLHKEVDARVQAEVSRYAVGKRQDGAVPVTAGGSTPAPAPVKDYHSATEGEQREMLRAYFNASGTVP